MGKYNDRMLRADQVPREMRVPHVTSGYRPLYQPWIFYARSLFRLHNETFNVWTHLVGLVLLAVQIKYYYHTYAVDGAHVRWTLLGHGACCSVTLFNSAVAHLLHSRSCYANFLVFMFDYIGVVSWGFGTAILSLYGVSEPEMYARLDPTFLTLQLVWTYGTYIIICMSKLWFGHDLEISSRKKMIVVSICIQGFSNMIPWFPRYVNCFASETCSLTSLNHVAAVIASFTLMTLTFVFHQPEKTWPGRFDIFGQSHQIFHVFVILTQSLQLHALHVDHVSGANAHCKPDPTWIAMCIIALNVSCILTLVYFRPHVHRKVHGAHNNNKTE